MAGVAWAQPHGIEKVEVRIDDGDWQEAELSAEVTGTTWRQWRLDWNATSGRHDVMCRQPPTDSANPARGTDPPDP